MDRLLAVNLLIYEILRRPAGDEIDSSGFFTFYDLFKKRFPGRQPGRMIEQMTKSSKILAEHAVHGNHARDKVVETQFFFLDQEHDRERHRQRFSERSEIENRAE